MAAVGSSFEAVWVIVKDLSRSAEFYRRLGVDLEPAIQDDGSAEIQFSNGMRIFFTPEEIARDIDPRFVESGTTGRVALAFRCSSPLEVDALHHDLVDAGYGSYLDPCDVPWGHRYASILDPDGIRIDLFSRLDKE